MSVLVGNIVKVPAIFKDEHLVKVDPAVVTVYVKDPAAQVDTYIYGTDPEVVREGVGEYYIEIDTSNKAGGTYQVIWTSTGTYQATGQTQFVIADTYFTVPPPP
jgi:hypothetical protein